MIVSGAACTVSVVLAVIPFNVAEMVVVPGLTAKAMPFLLTLAKLVFKEVQVTCAVMFNVLPSE